MICAPLWRLDLLHLRRLVINILCLLLYSISNTLLGL